MAKAKMKIDMKQINKFRFWIGLGVLVVLLLALSYLQLTAIGGEKEQKAYAEKLKAVKGLSDFKNEKLIEIKDGQIVLLNQKKISSMVN